jgi:hypothetical protein
MTDTTNITTARTVRTPGWKSLPAGSEVEILDRRAPGRHLEESFLVRFSNGCSTWVRARYILNREGFSKRAAVGMTCYLCGGPTSVSGQPCGEC